MAKSLLHILVALALAMPAAAQAPEAAQSAANIKAHMGFLASDLLQGREAGSAGFDIAANYVASQFAQLGLKPAGAGGSWFQPVPLLAARLADEGRYTLTARDGSEIPLTWGVDVTSRGSPALGVGEKRLAAPLVFVGYGIVDPRTKRDDYKGLDVKGKIVVLLNGAPPSYQSEERAYFGSRDLKAATAGEHGAVGVIGVRTPEDEARGPFAAQARGWRGWSMTWRRPDGGAYLRAPGVAPLGLLSASGVEKVFAGAPKAFAEVVAAAEKPKHQPPRFALPYVLNATLVSEQRTVESKNVAGMIEGADPRLKDEVVVLSAHLDHIGVGPPINGDSINNGALDNAAGVATTLEVARTFQESGKRPRRSILFLTVTAEEKGLLGAQFFAQAPTVSRERIVANVDLDMPILTYDFTDVVALGADRSDIGPAVRRAAARMGVALSPDPQPEEGDFVRSDHFRFVEAGVPAVYLEMGYANGGEAKTKDFLARCYHKPCDDLSQPIDYAVGAKFARLNYEVTRELTDMDSRPLWVKGDFFGTRFAPPTLMADH